MAAQIAPNHPMEITLMFGLADQKVGVETRMRGARGSVPAVEA